MPVRPLARVPPDRVKNWIRTGVCPQRTTAVFVAYYHTVLEIWGIKLRQWFSRHALRQAAPSRQVWSLVPHGVPGTVSHAELPGPSRSDRGSACGTGACRQS